MKIERVKVNNKNITNKLQMDVDVSRVRATRIIKLHQTTGNIGTFCYWNRSRNLRLKARIKELDEALNLVPLFMAPLEIHALASTIYTPDTHDRFKKTKTSLME